MKSHQDNTNGPPALLCTCVSVDTLETNSLCCAAAGIIATSNATAEALIPHEKLRGAALADATLNAQERPLAQPVVGGKQLLMSGIQLHCSQLTSPYGNNLGVVCKNSSAPQYIFLCPIREQTSKNNTLLKSAPNHQERFNHLWQRQIHRINSLQSHQLRLNRGDNLRFESHISGLHVTEVLKKEATYIRRPLCNTTDKLKNHLVPLPTRKHGIPSLLVTDVKGRCYSRDTSKRLEPLGSVLPQIKRIEHNKQRPAQGTNRQEKPNYPHTSDFQSLQNFKSHRNQRLPAIKQSKSLIIFETDLHGGAA